MPLFVVATPIGNNQDFTERARQAITEADLVIGEELKVLRQTLKAVGVQARAMDQLNEHSGPADIEHFVEQCRTKNVALVSDCGTPGFCDPGADLVRACHDEKIRVVPVPGASSLMTLLAVCGERLDTFVFAGFLPAKNERRAEVLKSLTRETRPLILMETPYRCARLIEDLRAHFADRLCIVGLNLTQDQERVVRARGRDLDKHIPETEAEPIVIVMPQTRASK